MDASAVAAVIFAEAEGEAVSNLIAGAQLVAPALIELELANVCVSKSRRAPTERQAFFDAFDLRHQLGIEHHPVDAAGVVMLALETGLSAYDASYLWLSRQLGAELVTLDRRL